MDEHEAMVAERVPADAILTSVLEKSGYLAELHDSSDPQDETRLENLFELITVAREFVSGAAALAAAEDVDELGEVDELGVLDRSAATVLGPRGRSGRRRGRAGPVARAPSWSGSRWSPTPTRSRPDRTRRTPGVVTLMTLHTAKGLEFDNVFLTGLEDGVFPHQRALTDKSELAEERRLAYVGITRARKRLYISRAIVRTAWGSAAAQPAQPVPGRDPGPAVRLAADRASGDQLAQHVGDHGQPQPGGTRSATGRRRRRSGRSRSLVAGDRVLHTTFGMGKVVATSGEGDKSMADVDFGSSGLKRLSLKHAPLEKM